MKVFLSSDMEGTAGIVDWSQCIGDGQEAVEGRRLLLGEVNAAITGALAGGADEVLVNDSHSSMRNLPAESLAGRADYLSGAFKPLYMMQGLDDTFDAVLFVSYHCSVGAAANLSHTYNPRAFSEIRLNGTVTGEAGINALVAAAHGVPVVLITGDRVACEEAAVLLPGIHQAIVKEPVSRNAARSMHPERARAVIAAAATGAVRAAGSTAPPDLGARPVLDLEVRTTDVAEQATWIRGVERTGPRSLRIADTDPLSLYRTFVTLVFLTRGAADVS
jgi:D-amino peptidase